MIDYEKYQGFLDPSVDRSVLKDARNGRKTEQLFVEITTRSDIAPLYSLRPDENKGYISAYQVYMHSVDETEAALKLVGTLDHWRKLCGLKWFLEGRSGGSWFEGILQWREDKAALDASRAKDLLQTQANLGNVSAQKELIRLAEKAAKETLGGSRTNRARKQNEASRDRGSKITELHRRNFGGE